ncbi:DUF937 domain-containing protein [Fibrella sp. WM1]|uniref:DUF937 domain-containing protein n=1 Tax=Fibrella musci TaxID=3242485 RepID=UPI003522FE89
MATPLLDHLHVVFTHSASRELARTLLEPEAAMQKAVDGLLPAMTMGVLNRASNDVRVAELHHVLIATPFGQAPTLTQLVQPGTYHQQAAAAGNTMLRRLYGERGYRLAESTAHYSGVSVNSASVLTGLIMSVLMRFLNQQLIDHQLTEKQLATLLARETAAQEAVPAGLACTLNWFVGTGRPVVTSQHDLGHARRVTGFPWSRWLLIGSGLLLLCFLLVRICSRSQLRLAHSAPTYLRLAN